MSVCTLPVQPELFNLPEPSRRSEAQLLRREVERFAATIQEVGPLVPASVAIRTLRLSKARVYQLLDSGALRRWKFFNQVYLSLNDLETFKRVPRPTGRRRKEAA